MLERFLLTDLKPQRLAVRFVHRSLIELIQAQCAHQRNKRPHGWMDGSSQLCRKEEGQDAARGGGDCVSEYGLDLDLDGDCERQY